MTVEPPLRHVVERQGESAFSVVFADPLPPNARVHLTIEVDPDKTAILPGGMLPGIALYLQSEAAVVSVPWSHGYGSEL